jgi:hypothetical protein
VLVGLPQGVGGLVLCFVLLLFSFHFKKLIVTTLTRCS